MAPRPTGKPIVEDLPHWSHHVLKQAGALNPGVVTHWKWITHGDVPSVWVAGDDGFFVIADGSSEIRVLLRASGLRRFLVCPNPDCERCCRYLLRLGGWGCRRCLGAENAVRHRWRTVRGAARRRKLLRALAREPPLSLKASEIRYQLWLIDREVSATLRKREHDRRTHSAARRRDRPANP